jgi:hypothetical protein
MATSKHKTTLAVLRSILGPGAGGEARFAKKIGRSVSWVKKASCGTIPLTRDAALAIAYETGINHRWLIMGDTSKPPIDKEGNPYTTESYANHWKQDLNNLNEADKKESFETLEGCITQLLVVHLAAVKKNRGGLFQFQLFEFIQKLDEQFGHAYDEIYKNEETVEVLVSIVDRILNRPPPPAEHFAKLRRQKKRYDRRLEQILKRQTQRLSKKTPSQKGGRQTKH